MNIYFEIFCDDFEAKKPRKNYEYNSTAYLYIIKIGGNQLYERKH